ncbi:hypothetical protein CVN68_10440 [Sphingomonas psychrotolerans]|uniref:Uncharacterized protein n=1 Tax=Sphingomonas psychrotolerans TaxID=1327635 RepID=A0A2K8MEL7_9SPHN|nr:hypothetical protein CVN68_10440 [Sphingomonas psychrotolerans]
MVAGCVAAVPAPVVPVFDGVAPGWAGVAGLAGAVPGWAGVAGCAGVPGWVGVGCAASVAGGAPRRGPAPPCPSPACPARHRRSSPEFPASTESRARSVAVSD